ncbi:MAG: ABC transporter permease, partial [Actinomycetia bacterium]|nr:ABC transporter permease [Actinomycetes bacterium]
ADVLLWISPIGWGQKVDPWGANRAWPMLLQVLLALVLIAVAWMLETRRDLGAGLVAARPGSSKALRLTTTSVGLSLRTQRASIIAWLLGVMIMGDLLGGVVQKMADMIESSGAFTGAAVQAGLNGTVALMAGIMALAITAFAIQSVSTVRANEEAGLAEAQLAGPLSRTGWALRRLAVAFVVTIVVLVVAGGMMGYAYVASGQGIDPSWQTTCVKAVLVYLPAVALLMSVFVLGFGWWPRQCVAVTWAVLALMFIGTIVGVATGIPQRILDLMPYQALPAIPAVPMNWTPVLVESAIAVVFTVAGLAGFRRRNVPVL